MRKQKKEEKRENCEEDEEERTDNLTQRRMVHNFSNSNSNQIDLVSSEQLKIVQSLNEVLKNLGHLNMSNLGQTFGNHQDYAQNSNSSNLSREKRDILESLATLKNDINTMQQQTSKDNSKERGKGGDS